MIERDDMSNERFSISERCWLDVEEHQSRWPDVSIVHRDRNGENIETEISREKAEEAIKVLARVFSINLSRL